MPILRYEGAPRRAIAAALVVASLALLGAGCRREPAPVPEPASAPETTLPTPLVSMSATVEPASAPPGGAVTVLWRLRPAPEWHLYWPGRNDSGFAPRQKLELPAGWKAGPLRWPTPTRHVEPGDILDHIYEGELVLLQDVQLPADAPAGRSVELRAGWEWLACRDRCVPGRDSLAVAIRVVAEPQAAPSPRLAEARARMPLPLPPGVVRTSWEGATLTVQRTSAATTGDPGRLTFMPADDCGDLADLLHDGVGSALALRMLPQEGRVGPVRGLIVVEDATGPARSYVIDEPAVPWTDPTVPATPTGG